MEEKYYTDEIIGRVSGGTIQGRIATVFVASGESYSGEYTVSPAFSQQVLPTKDKLLNNNITVNAISVYKTTNASGGNTIVIGD